MGGLFLLKHNLVPFFAHESFFKSSPIICWVLEIPVEGFVTYRKSQACCLYADPV